MFCALKIEIAETRIGDMRYETVSIEKINFRDERFRTSYHSSLDRLILSIKKVGLVSPPLVRRGKKGFVVITGWKRILACRELRLRSLNVLVTEEPNDLDLFLAGVHENLAAREIGLVEKSVILGKLVKFGQDEKSLFRVCLPLLCLPATRSALDLLLALSKAEKEAQVFVQDKGLPFVLVQSLLQFRPEERRLLFPLLRPLGQNKQKEMLEDLHEVSRRDDVGVVEILKDRNIQRILRGDKLSSVQKAEGIRSRIREKRYPRWRGTLESFSATLKALRWPKEIAIQPSPFFEDENFSVSFRFQDREQFNACVSRLQQLGEREGLSGLFQARKLG